MELVTHSLNSQAIWAILKKSASILPICRRTHLCYSSPQLPPALEGAEDSLGKLKGHAVKPSDRGLFEQDHLPVLCKIVGCQPVEIDS